MGIINSYRDRFGRRTSRALVQRLEARRLLTGDYLNAITIGCTQFDASNGIAVDGSGNAYVIGTFRSTMDFDPGTVRSNDTLTIKGESDVFVAKYNSSGVFQWVNGVPNRHGQGNEAGGIVVDRSQNVYITGNIYGDADFGYLSDGSADPLFALNRTDNHHPFVAKLNPNGTFAWAKVAEGGTQAYVPFLPPEDASRNRARGLAFDNAGNLLVTGNFNGAMDFDASTASGNVSSVSGSSDAFLWKLTAAGAFSNIKTFGGTGQDVARAVTGDAGGNVFLAGSFDKTFSFGATSLTNGTTGTDDGFVVKYNSSLSASSGARFGGTTIDRAQSVAVDKSGMIWVAGFINGAIVADPNTGNPSLDKEDIELIRYSSTFGSPLAITLGASPGRDEAVDLALDGANNVYVAGYFANTVDFDPSSATKTLKAAGTTAGKVDVFILKLTSAGGFVWVRQLGGASPDFASAIALDTSTSGSPNVYTTGIFTGTADFDPGPGTKLRSVLGVVDTFISKLSQKKPDFFSATQIGGTGTDTIKAVASDAAGNAYVLGTFSGSVDFDPTSATVSRTAAAAGAVYVAKYLPFGKLAWVQTYSSTLSSLGGAAISVDASGNHVYVAFTAPRTSVPGDTTLTVSEFSSSGALTFSKFFGAVAASGVAGDASGNIVVAGSFHGTVDFDLGAGTKNLNGGAKAAFALKLNSSGNFVWADQFGGAAGTSANINTIALASSGEVYAAGDWNGSVDFDPASATTFMQAGSNDAFVLKLASASGGLVAQSFKSFTGAGKSAIKAIALDSANNLYATGFFDGTCDFNPSTTTTTNRTSAGLTDAFLVKLNSSGSYATDKEIGGTGNDAGIAIAVDALSNVSLLGTFASSQVKVSGSATSYAAAGTLLFRFSSSGALLTPPIKTLSGAVSVAVGAGGSYIYLGATYSGTDPTSGIVSHGTDGLLSKYVV